MPKRTRKREWQDDYTLLCERCGYILEGLDTATPCPECAKPITESLPERRIGTPWQQKPGFVTMVKTWWITLRHPKRTASILNDSTLRRSRLLAYMTIMASAFVGSAGFASPLLVQPEHPKGSDLLGFLIVLFTFMLIPFCVFSFLTVIETKGLRVFSNSKGRKLTKNLSIAITAHGCVGWLMVSVLYALTNLASMIFVAKKNPIPPYVEVEIVAEYYDTFANSPPQWVGTVVLAATLLSLAPGFLIFELFAYLGLRRCKYANRIRPYKQQDPSPGLAESVESKR
tara:strand:- start:18597 stop:19451 length:855 start_codon:yes stop_codon:yes gene_type:complete